jgi:hypothetical protein
MDKDLVELRRRVNGCEAEFQRRLTRFESGQGYAASGALSPKPWLRWQGCRFPGCDCPPAWTDGHHLEHWADGKPTLPWNLVLLCRRHHYRVHEEGWRLGWGASGELIAQPP